ncbi:peptide synthetase [Sorangium cellulosum]|uniref:Peptide synthetase n=1 Tax=Sorangium cellulosum TaxID=56 RepID=A0A4P2Q1Y5_SORCE|nr:myxochelin non-ribosomal peptide synthetase MxcG [Sorangium cellulosum]AUX23111.1 peptide synthetase [Sorangium cellulosum]
MVDPREARWPLSAAQHGIWLGQQLDPASPVYNAGECIEILGPVDRAVLEASVRQAVSEAEALHMRFTSEADEPRQILGPSSDWPVHHVDVSAAPDPWAAALAWMREDLDKTVDLGRGPLFAEALFTAGPDRTFWYQRAHHVALDGYGFSLIARRVADLYTVRIQDRPCGDSAFGPLRRVVEEDLAYRASPALERDRAFWSRRFADRPEPVSLTDRPAPMSRTFLRQTASLSPACMDSLRATARRAGAGASWPDAIVAATAAYLSRLAGAPEVVLGLPVMGRLGSASLRVPSMVMNIVPLRVPVRPGASLTELTRLVAEEVRAIRPHLRYRYEQLRRDLRRIGGEKRLFGPVVNIMPFDYDLRFAGQRAIAHNLSAGPVEDLSIGVYARSDGRGPRVDLDANPACYGAEELAAHKERLLALLAALAAAPDQAVDDAALDDRPGAGAPPPARGALLDGGPLPAPARAVVEQFAERARERPAAIAVEHGPRRATYGELERAARALAARLAARGAGPDTLVAVLLPRSVDAITAILGVLLSGAGYLPLDPAGPGSRTAAILDDAAPALLVTTSEHAAQARGLLEGARATRLVLLDDEPAPAEAPAPAPAADEHLAYVIYTSGSTGRPNGVMVSRGALAHFVAGATRRYDLRRDDRVLQFAPLHFDASVEEIFLTLCAGATLVLRTDEMLQSVPRLLEACAEHGITVLDLPTAFWHELAYSISTGAASLPPGVRTVLIGGEAALPERVARWRAAVGRSARLLNTYGPTEATVVATVATLSGAGAGDDAGDEVPIGTPLPGVRAALLDARGRPVARGAVGELHLIGPALSRGYLGRPELDAARFVRLDQLPGRPRAYRTGDLVRARDDGQLVFVGRVDDELKISGHRVDPLEVETALLRHPSVREAAVVGHASPDGSKRLTAFVVAGDPAPPVADLRRHARSLLPAAAVPTAFVLTDRLERTSSGKIDRAALRKAPIAAAASTTAAGATALEQAVLRVWEQVLGVSDLSTHDDFFERGGQSLQTIQVANRLSVELGREIPVAMVFRHPTVAELAGALDPSASAAARGGPHDAMLADAELPEDVVPRSLAPSGSPPRLQKVVLTGASGFVGAHLLHELLTQTDARVVCLVRAESEAHAAARIQRALQDQRLPAADLASRVVAVPADLALPLCGLSAARFDELARGSDAIYHDAAVVSVVRDYRSLRAANVLGTREVLRLAAAARPKPLHHVSTLAVAPSVAASPEVPEAFVPPHPGLSDGYQQSKWAAERLVQQAGERGLPVAVYRLGRVVGAPGAGLVNEQDLVFRLLRAGIPAGLLPDLDVREVWTPVDYVARAIVRLSLAEPARGAVYNVAPGPEVRLAEIFGWARDYGYPVERCPVPIFRARLRDRADAADSATLAFFDLQPGATGGEATFGLGRVRCDNVTRGLAGSGVVCPPIDRALLHRYLDHCVERGLLPRPPGPGQAPPRAL